VCIPGEPSETMAPLIAELEELLSTASAAAGLESESGVTAVWGLVHGLGTLCAAGHFSLDDALAASAEALARMLSR